MATLKEIKGRIKSVRDTSKVTGAMYMISSMKLRSCSSEHTETELYFRSLEQELVASDKGLCGD